MAMSMDGLTKLIEECCELGQVAAKKTAYYDTDDHPDGAGSLSKRMEDEMGDVLAAILFVTETFNLSTERIEARKEGKLQIFRQWHADPDNYNSSGRESHLKE